MSKELAQTVGGKRVAWLLALLAAFAVAAAVGARWNSASATVTAGSYTVTGPFTTSACATAAGPNIAAGTNVWYCIASTGDPAVVNPLTVTFGPTTGLTFTGTIAPSSGPAPTCTGPGASITCTYTGLTGTSTFLLAVQATVTGDAGPVAVLLDDPSSTGPTAPGTNSSAALNAVSPVGLSKSVSPSTVGANGGTVTWTITINNGSNNPADTFAIPTGGLTDTVPAGLGTPSAPTYTGWGTNPTCSFSGSTLTCSGGVLNGGQTGTISFTTTVPPNYAGTTFTNTVNLAAYAIAGVNFPALNASATLTQNGAYLVHVADNGAVIAEQEVNNNVRGSQHTVCVVTGSGTSLQGVTVPGLTLSNINVTNGGGYLSTADTDPTFTDPQIITGTGTGAGGNGLPNGATCIRWRSLDAGDQTISLLVNGQAILGANGQGLVKEWNRLEDSVVTLSGGASGTGTGNSTTTPVITRTLGLVLNPLTGQYQGATVTISDTFRGSHTNSAGQPEGPMPLAGVVWQVDRAPGSSSCGTLGGALSGTTTLLNTAAPSGSPNTHDVGGTPSVTFNPTGCNPGQVVTIRIRGSEPGALGSGTPTTVTQLVQFEFAAQIPAKHVFLAWAGQRVVLEHNWAIDPSSLSSSGQTCPTSTGGEGAVVQYIKGSGPGNFVPGGTVYSIDTDSEAWADLSTGSQVGQQTSYPACTSVAVFESEDQGQVDIEAFIDGEPASKVAWVVYYMKIERVNLSLVTQVSKPTHNSSAAPDWAPGNPWDASKDDADGTTEWNVSKDILVRGRVSGWFVNSNPSGRPADTSNPLNVLPANRWVMPNDWPLLAGGPDGEEAYGTAEQFRPYYDIMIAPNNVLGLALANPDGLGLNLVALVRSGNTGVGSATSPISVTTCASLQAGNNIVIGASTKTVASCTGTSLVVTAPFSSPPAAGTPIFKGSGVPVVGPYSALDIVGLVADGFGTTAPWAEGVAPFVRDTAWKDYDVDWWDAPMPPAPVSIAIRGTGFIKQVLKDEVYYLGTPNTPSVAAAGTQVYPNPFYYTEIPESPFISAVAAGGGYMWDSWGTNGAPMGDYRFWYPVRIGVNSAGIGETLSSADITELGIIRTAYGDTTIARDLVVFSDNHGEFMVAANGDFKTDLSACATNALAGGKHCKPGDKVGKGTITATADYPDFRGKHFPVASNAVNVDWTWGGYKDVTIEKGETDQFVYVVFHALDRDGFCSVPTGAVSLHPVLTSADDDNDFSSLGARYNSDPVENVDFLIDSGEGIIIGQSGGGTINDGRRFATGVTTFSVAANDPASTGIKEFPLSPLAAQGQTDECQAWIKVSNSLLGIVNVLAIAHDDEGNIGFDRVIDLQTTTSYTLNFRWSLITWAGANNIPVMDAIKGTGKNDAGNDISASVTAIYGWDAAGQKWLGFFPAGVNVPGANDLTALKTGEAYWIAITGPSSVTWTIATNVD